MCPLTTPTITFARSVKFSSMVRILWHPERGVVPGEREGPGVPQWVVAEDQGGDVAAPNQPPDLSGRRETG